MVNLTAQALKLTQTDKRASGNAGNCLFQWIFSCRYTKTGDKYDTCVINKIGIWVDVFERKRGEMEINDHFYSTAHFLPKQLKNKSRSGELKNSSGKFFWGRIFQSGNETRLWLHRSVHVLNHLLGPELWKYKQILTSTGGGILVWTFRINRSDGGRWSHVWHTLRQNGVPRRAEHGSVEDVTAPLTWTDSFERLCCFL